MTLPEHLQNLNPPQLEAVGHLNGPILVLAGAGSGKTRVLTRRIVNLVHAHGIYPDRIIAVTFTNKAADEMRHRLDAMLGQNAKGLWVATFHSAALRMLRRHAKLLGYSDNFVVYDEQDSTGLIKRILRERSIDEKQYSPGMFSRAIDRAKNAGILADDFPIIKGDPFSKLSAEVYNAYQVGLKQANAMDFGDLLLNAVLLLRSQPEVLALYRDQFRYILVDEFQDTNQIQYDFIRLIAEPRHNLLVVGDDDQSIYAFRGASITNILGFEKDYPGTKVIKLEQNYRSTGNILAAAHAVIEKNTGRKEKKLWTAEAAGAALGTFVGEDEIEEAEFVAKSIQDHLSRGAELKQIAVFYRTNAQSRAIEEALIGAKIPYRIFGGLKFYDRKEIKDILGYLRLLINPRDNQAFLRIVNTPTRGIGAQTINSVLDRSRESGLPLLEAARPISQSVRSLHGFLSLYDKLSDLAQTTSLGKLIEEIISQTKYDKKLKTQADSGSDARLENLAELVVIGRSMEAAAPEPFEQLRLFLDRVALVSGADTPVESKTEQGDKIQPGNLQAVSLMTLHLAKGLEFPIVFLTGLEEGLLPHYRAIGVPTELEEERRLCYVGLTRAMRQLYLSRARHRGLFSAGGGFGMSGYHRLASRFVADIPPDCLDDCLGEFAYRSSELYVEPEHEVVETPDFEDIPKSSLSRKPQTEQKYYLRKKSGLGKGFLSIADEIPTKIIQKK